LCVLLVLRRHAGDAAALPSYRRLAAAAASAAALAPASDAAGTARADLAAARALLEAWPRDKPRACITVLARNSDLEGVLHSVGQLERRFNARPANRYPYCYLNEKPFSAAFRHAVAAATQAPVLFGLVPAEHWSYPPHINQTRAAEVRAAARERMPYGGSESYRFMCRYFSGFFFDHPLLAGFDWYWRVEPEVDFMCQIEEDPFKAMAAANQSLAWTIVMSEVPETIPGLWPAVQQWLQAAPQHLAPDSLLPAFLDGPIDHGPAAFALPLVGRQQQHRRAQATGGGSGHGSSSGSSTKEADSGSSSGDGGGRGPNEPPLYLQRGYTGCHFWSNFEIGRLGFFRSAAYRSFFAHLEAAGGFFYERWGDAPVHTLAAAVLLDRPQIRWAKDIGYHHGSWSHCPLEPEARPRCDCNPHWDVVPGDQPSCQLDFLTRLAALERRSSLAARTSLAGRQLRQ
jgi:uncharacterized membrane protein YgcG